jgi:hypothetical protein
MSFICARPRQLHGRSERNPLCFRGTLCDPSSADDWSMINVSDAVLSNTSNFEWRRATVPVQPGETRKFLRLEIQQQNYAPVCLGSNGHRLRPP